MSDHTASRSARAEAQRERARKAEGRAERLRTALEQVATRVGLTATERHIAYHEHLITADSPCPQCASIDSRAKPRAAPSEAVPEIDRLKAENASLLESLREVRESHTKLWTERTEIIDRYTAAEQRAEAAEKRLAGLRGYHLCEATIPKPKPHRCNDTSGYYEPDGPLHWLCRRHAAGPAALHDEERSAPPQEEESALVALRKELERNIADLNEANEACCSAEVERDDAIAEMTRLQEAVERGHTDACATYVATLRAGLEREIARRDDRIAALFDAIAHGDDKHRAWLREAIEQHFGTAAAQGEEK